MELRKNKRTVSNFAEREMETCFGTSKINVVHNFANERWSLVMELAEVRLENKKNKMKSVLKSAWTEKLLSKVLTRNLSKLSVLELESKVFMKHEYDTLF